MRFWSAFHGDNHCDGLHVVPELGDHLFLLLLHHISMARPNKHNAEYFSHDNDMRNDEKILAIRRKFWLEGYAIWNMLLEKLCDQHHWKLDYNAMSLELLGWDFMIDPERLDEIVQYCVKIWLLILDGELLYSQRLIERFEILVDKREKMRLLAEKRWHKKKEKKTSSSWSSPAKGAKKPAWSRSIINKTNKEPATKIYELIKRYNHGVIDWTLNDCVYLLYKIQKIDGLEQEPHELLDLLLQAIIQNGLHEYYSISNPSKICDKLGDMMNRVRNKVSQQWSQVLVV